MMMMMMGRVMCVLAVVLCCACGYTMAAAAAVDNDSPSGRGVSRGAVEVSCGAGGALRVRPAAESEWLTCGAGSRVSACGKYADLCRQRTARAATRTTTRTAVTASEGKTKPYAGEDKAGSHWEWDGFPFLSEDDEKEKANWEKCNKSETREVPEVKCSIWKEFRKETSSQPITVNRREPHTQQQEQLVQNHELIPNQREGLTNGDHPEQDNSVVVSPGVSAERKEELTLVPAPEPSPTKAAEPQSTPEGTPESERTENPPTGEHTTEEVDTNQTNPQTQSESAPTSSEETNTTTPPSSENTTTEAPTETPSPVPNPEINTIASTVQKNKGNVDSSLSPVWVRTAAPLLIVAMLFSITVY
ncbi:uncharacterized protein TM35_000621220 [Trypanosoma theileri]|uniref:Mucin-associated surface protein (MASP) n=1 Tax=Trypanosoma theileri TaxID=67003 RepID=A0A1X0NGK8_9TRYP|nr:uncharacterized protein TM35_000621220 [Trypanosoma theileri]ORC83648.1 hypothetical protein TM35_000621220 [Trypanosoma theileri]